MEKVLRKWRGSLRKGNDPQGNGKNPRGTAKDPWGNGEDLQGNGKGRREIEKILEEIGKILKETEKILEEIQKIYHQTRGAESNGAAPHPAWKTWKTPRFGGPGKSWIPFYGPGQFLPTPPIPGISDISWVAGGCRGGGGVTFSADNFRINIQNSTWRKFGRCRGRKWIPVK